MNSLDLPRQPLLSERELANYLAVSLETVRRLRYGGRGPRYARVGAQVRYDLDDVQAWRTNQSGVKPQQPQYEEVNQAQGT